MTAHRSLSMCVAACIRASIRDRIQNCMLVTVCCLALHTSAPSVAAPVVAAQAEKSPVLARAPRGASGSFEISYDASLLRAKPSSDLTAPILVRLNELAPTRYRIEYMGLVSGIYDLAPYLEHADGRPALFTSPLTVEVFTQLPPNHGTDIFGLSAPSFGIRAHYREIMIGLGALWIAIPSVALARHFMRRKPKSVEMPAPAIPTLEEKLFALVHDAQARALTIDERGRLELMLLRTLRAHASRNTQTVTSPAELAESIASLRRDASCGPIIVAVERWLHADNDGDARDALAALVRLKATNQSQASSAGGAP